MIHHHHQHHRHQPKPQQQQQQYRPYRLRALLRIYRCFFIISRLNGNGWRNLGWMTERKENIYFSYSKKKIVLRHTRWKKNLDYIDLDQAKKKVDVPSEFFPRGNDILLWISYLYIFIWEIYEYSSGEKQQFFRLSCHIFTVQIRHHFSMCNGHWGVNLERPIFCASKSIWQKIWPIYVCFHHTSISLWAHEIMSISSDFLNFKQILVLTVRTKKWWEHLCNKSHVVEFQWITIWSANEFL